MSHSAGWWGLMNRRRNRFVSSTNRGGAQGNRPLQYGKKSADKLNILNISSYNSTSIDDVSPFVNNSNLLPGEGVLYALLHGVETLRDPNVHRIHPMPKQPLHAGLHFP